MSVFDLLGSLFSSSFLFTVAIIIILFGATFAYVNYIKIQQDIKLNNMMQLVSMLTHELTTIKRNSPQEDDDLKIIKLREDDNDSEDNRTEEEDDGNMRIIDIHNEEGGLISVSDDEGDDEDDVDVDGESVNLDSDLDLELIESDYEIDISEMPEMPNMTEMTNIVVTKLELEEEQEQSQEQQQPIELDLGQPLELEQDMNKAEDVVIESAATAATATAEVEPSYTSADYKKMSLNKLREIAVKKSLTTSAESSKLKKTDIYKLLGIEHSQA